MIKFHIQKLLYEILSLSVYTYKQCSKLYYSNFRQLTCLQSDDIRCCVDTIRPPEDEQGNARNMQRILINVLYIYIYIKIKKFVHQVGNWLRLLVCIDCENIKGMNTIYKKNCTFPFVASSSPRTSLYSHTAIYMHRYWSNRTCSYCTSPIFKFNRTTTSVSISFSKHAASSFTHYKKCLNLDVCILSTETGIRSNFKGGEERGLVRKATEVV
jgi:hypothetical protein